MIFIIGLLVSSFTSKGEDVFQQNGLNPEKLPTQYIIDSWTTDNGLPNNGILDIEKTQDGYLWIATYGGLFRFDGTNFQDFPELSDVNGIRSLRESENGELWIGSDDGSLIKYSADNFIFLEIDDVLKDASITSIEEDKNGMIWVGTRSGLAFVKDNKLHQFDHELLSNAFVYCVEVDNDNNVWIGSTGLGLFKYSNEEVGRYTTENGLINNSIRSLRSTREGLAIGSEGGLTIMSGEGLFDSYTTRDGLPHNYVNEILEDEWGTIWLGTDGGLTRLIDGKFETLDHSLGLSDNTVQALHEDQVGLLWVGTYRGGLNRLKDGKFINYGSQEGLNDELVYVSRSDGSDVWLGTDDGLSYLSEGMVKSVRLGSNPSINTIKDILVDPERGLWLGTSDGLINYRDGRILRKLTTQNGLSNNRVRRLSKDQEGSLWVATTKGLSKYDPIANRVESYGLNHGLTNEFILSLIVDSQNRIWVGTNGGGLFLFNGESFQGFNGSNDLESNIIFGLSEDDNGKIWIASNSGFSSYDGTKFSSITKEQGLPTNTVFQVIISDGYHWLFTDVGVVRITSQVVEEVVTGSKDILEGIRVLNKSEGMRTDQVTGVSVSDIHSNGDILISTLKGLSILNPSELRIGDDPTEVKITSIVKDGLELENNSEISFEPGTRYYEFHYTGLNFYSPEKIRFKYRIDGLDDEWVEAGNRRIAYYNDLPPGDYTFQVLASNSDGVWNAQPVELAFCQKAHFYETSWFYLFTFLSLAVGAFSWYKARVRLYKERNKKLTELVEIRTADVNKQNEELTQLNHIKDRLFSIISHDIRGPLDSLHSLLEILNKGQISEEEFQTLSGSLTLQLSDVKDLLNELLNWSRSQLDELSVNPEKINLKGIVDENFKLFESQAAHKQLMLRNNLPESEYVNADLNMTKVIVRNLISNAIKFSKNGGEIKVLSKASDANIAYSIIDNGVGIRKENQDKLFDKEGYTTAGTKNEMGTGIGLMLVKEFVEKNNGSVHVESEEGEGSTFKFTLPISR